MDSAPKKIVIKKTFQLGVPARLDSYIGTTDPIINQAPGRYALQSYDSEFLEVLEVVWLPGNEAMPNPCLSIVVIPKKIGETKLTTNMQYDQFQPLFIENEFEIKIEP